MQWDQVLGSLAGSGPLAGALAFALWKTWARLQEREKQVDALQQQLIAELKSLLTSDS